VVVTFGGQNMNTLATGDDSGLTSKFAPADNKTAFGTGYYGETFDPTTAAAFLPAGTTAAIPQTGISIASGCSINSYSTVGITVSGGGFGVQKGSTGGAAAPNGDSTCFGFGPRTDQNLTNAKVKIDYTGLLSVLSAANYGATFKISYLGVFYGSIDTYNSLNFYNGANSLAGGGLLSDGTLSGTEILSEMNGTSGNQSQPNSNVYVNLAFAPNEFITAFEFVTTSRAVELDNIWVGVTQIPEPASLALVGLGLVGVAAARRRKQAK
jgi:hypothetical protein